MVLELNIGLGNLPYIERLTHTSDHLSNLIILGEKSLITMTVRKNVDRIVDNTSF